ncbi:hypothetical protein [Pelotalea chapellei]|uniref:Carboxypeptidase regulatory-like domain-containing protein n=1 Tax=Pelotalea chapellei TaxID=44671 RepID=A0ABS5U573_9BACT|nr:hypothetical protein [Pelotalea chapellei]MBT1070816.1 hypothetical protein [Pelotalea chapellei]
MSNGLNLLLSGLIVIALCLSASASAKRQGTTWNYYHFNGQEFVAGQPGEGSFIAVRDGSLPVLLTEPAKVEAVALPAGKGAVAGISYIQSSGGKLGGRPGHVPASRAPVNIFSGNKLAKTVETDQLGYFTAVLDAGTYRIGTPPLAIEVVIKSGTTTLASLRSGKRMVD